MDDLDKKIVIASAGYEFLENSSNEGLVKFYELAKDTPNSGVKACRFKELFLGHLDEIAQQASQERSKVDWCAQQGYSWELKATARLFYEASFLIRGISDQCSVSEFQDEIRGQFRKKGLDWGYGSNWSDPIHHFVMKKLSKELSRFVSDIQAIYHECTCSHRG